jgi:hypothetical protein
MKTLETAILMILSLALPFVVQLVDRRRLKPEERAYAWNAATWGAALYACGPLSMMAWVMVTRWPRVKRAYAEGGIVEAVALAAVLVLIGLAIAVAMFFVMSLIVGLAEEPGSAR